MAFKYYGSLDPNAGRLLMSGDGDDGLSGDFIINNSAVIQIGDQVKTDANGNVVEGTAGAVVLGIIVGVGQNGISVDPDSGTQDVFTVASDNETVAKKYAIVDVSRNSLYSASQDGTAGATANSNKRGALINAVSENQLDEDTASRTLTSGGQFYTWGVDPVDSTRLIVSINESEIFQGGAGS